MRKVRITGAIASKTGITLYLEDGNELNLPKEGWRTKAIMDEVVPALTQKKIVEIDLDTFSIEERIEKQTGGLIRFVREKISSVKSWFKAPFEKVTNEGHDYGMVREDSEETLVAVIGDKRIPGIEALEKQMDHAAFTDNAVGLQRFLERLAVVVDERGHTVQELLNFMRRGDLPIADDGSIVAYKSLYRAGTGYVDCHSRNVKQRVGSYVHMDEKLVDPSKRTECSTGLHIARRAYVGRFSGDVLTIVKVAPEDVIAVPNNEPDKMRAAGYHIVAELSEEARELVRQNRPMTSNAAAAKLLADVISGNHIGITEDVKIGSAYGGDLTITPRKDGQPVPVAKKETTFARALDDAENVLSVKDIKQKMVEAAAQPAPEPVAVVEPVVTPEPAAPAPVEEPKVEPVAEKPKKAAAKKTKTEKVSEKAKPAKNAAEHAALADKSRLTEKQQKALKLRDEGKSNRAIEAELHICRKTLKKLFEKHPKTDG